MNCLYVNLGETMNKFEQIYETLYHMYGPQGWWPLITKKKTALCCEYHPKKFNIPKTRSQKYEICIGAILTQNTAWRNVVKALINLYQIKALSPKKIQTIQIDLLKEAIRPAGYFNQKAKKIQAFNDFYCQLDNQVPSRDALLSVWGIGPETADSMLLYAYKQLSFVVDTYTRRIFTNLGLIQENMKYDAIKTTFENNLIADLEIYQEYHALIVQHAKHYYQKKDKYALDPLLKSEPFIAH